MSDELLPGDHVFWTSRKKNNSHSPPGPPSHALKPQTVQKHPVLWAMWSTTSRSAQTSTQAASRQFPGEFRGPLQDMTRARQRGGHQTKSTPESTFPASRLVTNGCVRPTFRRSWSAMHFLSPVTHVVHDPPREIQLLPRVRRRGVLQRRRFSPRLYHSSQINNLINATSAEWIDARGNFRHLRANLR